MSIKRVIDSRNTFIKNIGKRMSYKYELSGGVNNI